MVFLMLEVRNLSASVDGKKILEDVNLKLNNGKVYALMGRNGSGKSTLANVLMGNPKYEITSGKITLDGEDITDFSADERAKKGLFMSFQNPVEVSGVKVFDFLRSSFNSINKNKLSLMEFQKLLEKKADELKINKEFLERYLNEGFSGGEKKKSEILQLLVLNPKVAILDETDSGLDLDSLKIVSRGISRLVNKEKIVLIITHYKRIFEHLNPDEIFIMNNGKITFNGGKEVIEELESKGFEKFENKNGKGI
ncbi:Fe-S cluster assembly ATPase SufC [Candidatus Pacearchaeota archaeon CG10_big_fil_rev_8_21_14_0_10_34_12]|nr:MAG: Fe-S cluster assembly ATPase SufC [Candidatus Pacearchaeota archaeon CG10_big_fil_rev_8_21_14_0_10_34_12]